MKTVFQRSSKWNVDPTQAFRRRRLLDKRILVVEDEYLIAWEIADFLDELGCEIVGPAKNLEEAAKLAGNQQLDGAVLDVRLRDETSEPIAQLLDRRCIPFIVVSGYRRSEIALDFWRAAYLCKPFDKLDLHLAAVAIFSRNPLSAWTPVH